ncbi:MAG: type II toxin-antitoxin system VapC family toxin [Planctomycetota bacterium]|nr:type II toxin-antitoxin system VapC family toxin [Planctomycetota bacterium]
MPESVYIETTIPSAYFELRRESYNVAVRALTRRWWKRYAPSYRCVSSEVVVHELSSTDYPDSARAKALELIQSLDGLTLDDPSLEAAETYLQERLMPADSIGDALHLALASRHGFTYLLTWNCRHLANPRKRRHIEVVNGRLGLGVPMLLTPTNLMRNSDGD